MPHGAIPFPFGSCRICDDKATGIHYGVATCEGCKGFFKRSLPKRDRYSCFFGGQCKITRFNRNRCKACRFKRCLDNGMAVEAVKMGRIPKMEKERALYEAQGTTGSTPCPGDDDAEDMEHDYPLDYEVRNQCDSVSSYRDTSLTADLSVAGATSESGTSSGRAADNFHSALCPLSRHDANQSENLSEELTMEGPNRTVHDFARNGSFNGPSSGVNGNLHHFNRNIDGFGEFQSSVRINKSSQQLSDKGPEFDHVVLPVSYHPSVASYRDYTQPIHSQISSSKQQPILSWDDHHIPSGHNSQSFGLHQSPTSTHFLPSRTTGHSYEAFESAQIGYDQSFPLTAKNNNLQRSFSYEIKREALDLSDPRQEQHKEHPAHDVKRSNYHQSNVQQPQTYSNYKMLKSDFDSFSQRKRQSGTSENGQKELASRRTEYFFPEDMVHCHNPFAHASCNDDVTRISHSRKILDTDSCKMALEDKRSIRSGGMIEGSSVGERINSGLAISNQINSASFASSTHHQQPQDKPLNNQSFPFSSGSDNDDIGDTKSFESAASTTSGCSGRRTAYSPDVVKVLLNQVGGERLKGLKQHLMTSIAPACCPEEFQAAADLLRQYSEIPSPTAGVGANSTQTFCQPNTSCVTFQPSQTVQMDTPEQGLFLSDKSLTPTPVSTYVTGVFHQMQSENTQTPASSRSVAHDITDNIKQDDLMVTNKHTNQLANAETRRHILGNQNTSTVSFSVLDGDMCSSAQSATVTSCQELASHSNLNASNNVNNFALASHSNLNTSNNMNNFASPKPLNHWASDCTARESSSTAPNYRGGSNMLSDQDQRSLHHLENYGNSFPSREEGQNPSNTPPMNETSSRETLRHCGSDNSLSSGQTQTGEEMSLSDLALTLSSAYHTHMVLFKVMHDDMQHILKGEAAMQVHPMIPEAKSVVYEQLIGSIEAINKAIIGFCNCVPGLSTLPKSDKDYLTKRAYYDIWMLTNSKLFYEGQTYLRLPDGTYYTREWMETILNEQIVQVFFNFSVAFNSLGLSDLEVAILCAIQLTSPGNESPGVCGITCREKVEHINSQLVDLLVLEVGKKHTGSGPRVLVDIFRLLPSLAEINTLQQEIIANFAADTVPENVNYSPKPTPLADLSEDQLNAVLSE